MSNIVLVRQGNAFPCRYVTMLIEMLEEHAKGHDVITLSDEPETPGLVVPLTQSLQGWWAKIELFAPWNRFLRPFLYLDLDTYVLGDISDILDWRPDRLAMLSDFYVPKALASGVMVVPEGEDWIWHRFNQHKTHYLGMAGGDQDCLADCCPSAYRLQDHFGGITSYKVHGADSGRIVCFHGQPKPHTASDKHPWVKGVWQRYA